MFISSLEVRNIIILLKLNQTVLNIGTPGTEVADGEVLYKKQDN